MQEQAPIQEGPTKWVSEVSECACMCTCVKECDQVLQSPSKPTMSGSKMPK